MIRALLIGGTLALAGCASPVVTRIETVIPAALPTSASFALVPTPEAIAPLQAQAVDLVAGSLASRGWRTDEAADVLLWVTLSDRSADAQLMAGDDFGKPAGIIGAVANRSNNKGCAKRDHRLTVTLANKTTGDLLYRGAASEYHCKARLEQTLPELATAALAGMDGAPGVREVERAGVR